MFFVCSRRSFGHTSNTLFRIQGGVVVKLTVYGTSMCFISTHLAAHIHHCHHRNANVRLCVYRCVCVLLLPYGTRMLQAAEILGNIRMKPRPELDISTQFHHCFWMGDLNYRSDMRLHGKPRGSADFLEAPLAGKTEAWAAVHAMVKEKDWSSLFLIDQLKAMQAAGKAFVGFQEGLYGFSPTFKMKRAPDYVYTEQRVPSYCDRVLWKSQPARSMDVRLDNLQAHPSVFTSDHKPVSAAFTVTCRAPPKPIKAKPDTLPELQITNLKGRDLFKVRWAARRCCFASRT